MPRTYPENFALHLMECHQQHLAGEGRRDLRFKPQVLPQSASELEQFKAIEMGDLWEDGNLLEALDYLMNSKRVRTGDVCLQ